MSEEPIVDSCGNRISMVEDREKSAPRTPGWQLVQTFYVLLLGVSAGGFIAPPLDTREGRWGIGLALANLTLVLLGSAVTWFGYRLRQPWAWWVVLATGLCYGIPMTLIDHLSLGWMGPVSVLEFLLLALWAAGLLLGSRVLCRQSIDRAFEVKF